MRNAPYGNRTEAGQLLAGALRRFDGRSDVLVLALPGVVCPWRMRWRRNSRPLWIWCSCGSSECLARRSWRWEPLPPEAHRS